MPSITASWSRNKVIWLVRLNGAVSHFPEGTLSWPPPLFASFEIANTPLSKAFVFKLTPSPIPPNSVKLNTTGRSFGNAGKFSGRRETKNRSTTFCRQINTEKNARIQKSVNRVMWGEKKELTRLKNPGRVGFSSPTIVWKLRIWVVQ